jgi:L-arabinose isomerase
VGKRFRTLPCRTAWIYAGGAQHTGFSHLLTMEPMEDFAEIAGVELVAIDAEARLRELRRQLRSSNCINPASAERFFQNSQGKRR